jgi:predicted DsbA family dithiol-disulfide isomerase
VIPLTALYIDFQSIRCKRAWRWLSLLPERAQVEVRPFSLDSGDGGDSGPWDRKTPSSAGLELLALGELARERGQAAHLAFVDAAFAAVHDSDADVSSFEAWLALGTQLDLDLDAFTADSERWRAEVGLWHEEAKDELGVSAVPALVFGERALYLALEGDVRDQEGARRLLDALAELAEQPVGQVRRTA